jgi:Cu2+-exporting ATPase
MNAVPGSLVVPAQPARCPHCAASVEGQVDNFCCAGCELAYQIVAGAGLQAYYAEREAPAPRPEGRRVDWAALPVETLADGSCEARFALDGMRCASCTWVTEHVLARTDGVLDAHVSYASGRATVKFDPQKVDLGAIVERAAALGYRPRPAEQTTAADRDLLVRMGLAAFVASNIMLLSATVYSGWWDGIEVVYAQMFRWIQLILATPAVTWAAAPFFQGAYNGLRHRVLHMDLPIALAIALLFGHAVVATFWHQDSYLDSLTMLIALLLGGRFLEARGRKRAGEAAAALASRLPSRARRVEGDGVREVPVSELVIGDVVEVGAGEEAPADGHVLRGQGRVHMALVTGEAEPVLVVPGDRLVAGAVVEEGALALVVDALGADTVGARMARQLQAATDRGTSRSAADRLAPWFVFGTLVAAGGAYGFWAWWADGGVALEVAVAVLVTACPCALGLSTPLATAAGLGAAARRGTVLRNGDALLALAEVQTIALDKTGTVTGGVPVVLDADDPTLRLAAGLERSSSHPIARAIVHAAMNRGLALPLPADVRETAGQGIAGTIDGQSVTVCGGGPGEVVVRQNGHIVGTIRLQDRRRDDAAVAVRALRRLGLEPTLLTGDKAEIAERVAAEAGVDRVVAGLHPDDKVAWIQARQDQGQKVLFVGDGLNDGPALARANVGLAMGTGAVSSVLVADGVVGQEALLPVASAIRVARAARRTVRALVTRSVLYNLLAVGAASVGLVNPLVAAILMPLSSAMVIFGALGVERRVRRDERQAKEAA